MSGSTRAINRMAPDDVFLLLINPPSKKKQVQKFIAKYVFDLSALWSGKGIYCRASELKYTPRK